MALLKLAVSVSLFAVGLGVSGDWRASVLHHYSTNCTSWPDPAPYPYKLRLLSEGKFTVKGFRELLACDYEPLPGWESLPRPHITVGGAARNTK
jgi:hypothetical protein